MKMGNIEWEALFTSLAADGPNAPAEPNAVMPSQDEHLTIDSDSEDHISVAPSIYSLTSSLRAQGLRQVHGRSLNAHSDIYHLPADEEEATRLSKSEFQSSFRFELPEQCGVTLANFTVLCRSTTSNNLSYSTKRPLLWHI